MDKLSEEFNRAHSEIVSAKKVLLATHEDPDGDGLSAMLAVAFWLRDIKKEFSAVISGELPKYLRFLPGTELLTQELPEEDYDFLIGFDYADFRRLGLDAWLGRHKAPRVITFDHHPEGRHKGDIMILDKEAASTTVMVYRFFERAGVDISPTMATCILTGIVVDTGGFMHANTNSEALRTAGQMMKKGANLARIVKETFIKKDPAFLRLWGEVLLRINLDPASGLALSRVTADDLKKYGAKREAMVEFSSLLNTVSGSRSAAFLSQEPDDAEYIKGSLRSEEYKGVDVSRLAASFGGGGHKLASGFKIKSEWKDLVEKLIGEARKL